MLFGSVGRAAVPCAEALSSLHQTWVLLWAWVPLLHVPPLSFILFPVKSRQLSYQYCMETVWKNSVEGG